MSSPGSKLLVFDPTRCTACHYCEIACSYSHFHTVDLSKANLHVIHDPATGSREVAHCLHCDKALCLDACPTGAVYRDEATKIVRLNPMKCVGCKSCVAACPIGTAWFHAAEGSARKCDLCDGEPKCAKFCSPGAIRSVDRKNYLYEVQDKGGRSND